MIDHLLDVEPDMLTNDELRVAVEALTLLAASLRRDGRDASDAESLRRKLAKARATRRSLSLF